MVLRTSFSISGYKSVNERLLEKKTMLWMRIHQLLSLERVALWKDQQAIRLVLLQVP